MARRNRVTPFGEIVAVAARGTLMGNRGGPLHDEAGRIVRSWASRRWITCLLEFRGRWRPVMTPGRYTELFFLDEATALAAGHRPCGECRHADYQRFRAAWAQAYPGEPNAADDLDRRLHTERVGAQRTHVAAVGDLPDGTMVVLGGHAWLVRGDLVRRWTPEGYDERRPRPDGNVTVLTPPSTVAVLRAGYRSALA